MICIFCLRDAPPSIEHVFPISLGGRLTINRVCGACNSNLGGKVDARLVNHPFAIFRCFELQIKNRSGTVPNPFLKVLGHGSYADAPQMRVRIEVDSETGKPTPRTIYHETVVLNQDGSLKNKQVVIDARDEKMLPNIIQSHQIRIEEPQLSESAIREMISSAKNDIVVTHDPEIIHNICIDTLYYSLGMLKIAYECTWLALGDSYIFGTAAQSLSKKILTGDVSEIMGNTTIGSALYFRFWESETRCHICYVINIAGRITAMVRVFDVFAAFFVMSEDPALVKQLEEQGGFFVCVNSQSGEVCRSSFATEVNRLGQT